MLSSHPLSSIVNATIATALLAPDPVPHPSASNVDNKNNDNDNDNDNNDPRQSGSSTTEESKPQAKKSAASTSATKEETITTTTTPPLATKAVTADERFYAVDQSRLQKLRNDKPWARQEPARQAQQQQQEATAPKRPVAKYFETLSLGPSAVTKIMMHCQSGVEKGIANGGNPTEVMGLMLGRPDPHKPTNLIVTDAFPLPIEGFETRVVADDQDVVNHMISLGERLELTRKEKFMGWYHSHPFDLVLGEDARSHCFLSQTDLTTQLQWQRAEDPHGNPFAAIVVDPLLSMHSGIPQLKAFRAYPPEYQSETPNECPDGTVVEAEKLRLERWGSCWNRYYELSIEYYTSEASRSVLGDLTQDYLWMRSFQRESSGGGAASVPEAARVAGLRKMAACANSLSSSSSSSAVPASNSHETKPLVSKLRSAATDALARQTSRCVQEKIFAGGATTTTTTAAAAAILGDDSDAIATTATN